MRTTFGRAIFKMQINPVKNCRLILSVLVALFSTSTVHAHKLGQSYTFLTIGESSVTGRFEVTVGDLNAAFPEQFKIDGSVIEADLVGRIDGITDYILQRTRFSPNGIESSIRVTGHRLLTLKLAQFVVIEFELDELLERPRYIDIHYSVLFDELPQHRGLLVVDNDWKTGTLNNEMNVLLAFAPRAMEQQLDLSSSSTLRGLIAMMRLGTHHIWIGIDHILFLVALLLPGVMQRKDHGWQAVDSFKPALVYLVKIITVFTIAHTITLSFATLSAVNLSPRIVESAIALSIAIAALDIIYPVFKQRIWLIVFGFGLFHGFGFASVLSEIGIPSTYMLYSLLGFNLGVEVGQLAIVCAVFPLLFIMRRWTLYRGIVLRYGAVSLMVVSLYWFVERGFEIDLPAGSWLNSAIELIA